MTRPESHRNSVAFDDMSPIPGRARTTAGETPSATAVPSELRQQALRAFDAESPRERRRLRAGTDWSVFLVNARILIEGGESELALDILHEILREEPHHSSALKLAADAYHALGETSEAVQCLARLSATRPDFESAYHLADFHYRIGHDSQAAAAYLEALSRLNSDHPLLFEVYKNLGNLAVRGGDFDGAEEYYNKAFTLNPDSDVLLVNFGTLEIQRQRYDRALERFRQAVERNQSNDRAWVGLALIHRHYGDLELAWGNVERALDLNPGGSTALHLLLDWAAKDARTDEAVARIRAYVAAVPQESALLIVAVQFLIQARRFLPARQMIEEIQALNPDLPGLESTLEEVRRGLGASAQGAF